ncbi:MAG: DUF3473 domain-containing protein, partial [Gammaproteobacteria bacterium]|nr:DUF3473 domain-containing protein [Gammaproteobacteria bacterium]
ELFEQSDVRATFFTLGWIAERYPEMIRRIADTGHEIASHGYSHVRVYQQDKDTFRNDITRTRKILEDVSGQVVTGYRAASFSINSEKHWAHEEIELAGYKYSSSIYPIHHDLYGIPGGARFTYRPGSGDLVEIPVSTIKLRNHRIPCGGGGYFRLLPYAIYKTMINRLNRSEGQSCIFYFHPWEIDSEQPRINGLDFKTRFRHYTNVDKMHKKLSYVLNDFKWSTMRDVFKQAIPSSNATFDSVPDISAQ